MVSRCAATWKFLVSLVASTPGITDVALTTNGSLLAAHAQSLRNAGLHRLTVSLDSLDPTVFAAMGDTKVPLSKVLDGIAAAADAVAAGTIDPTPMYTHRFGLDRTGDAMEAMASRPEGFLKALVCP